VVHHSCSLAASIKAALECIGALNGWHRNTNRAEIRAWHVSASCHTSSRDPRLEMVVCARRCPFHVRGECLNGNGKKTALQNNTNSVVLTFTNSPGIPIASVPYIFTSRQNKIGPSVRRGSV